MYGCTLWCVNYISIRLLKKNSSFSYLKPSTGFPPPTPISLRIHQVTYVICKILPILSPCSSPASHNLTPTSPCMSLPTLFLPEDLILALGSAHNTHHHIPNASYYSGPLYLAHDIVNHHLTTLPPRSLSTIFL